MSTTRDDAAFARLVRVLRSEEDIRRGIRVDQRIANDGNVIIDNDLGLIRMIENIDADRENLTAVEISLIDKLLKLRDEVTSPVTGAFVYDSFSAADGTFLTSRSGETGATWTSDGGAFTIHNGRIYGTALGFLYASGIPPTADYKVEAEFTRLTSITGNAIAVRVQPGFDTGYFLYFHIGAFRLFKRVNGVETSLGTVTYSYTDLPAVATLAVTGSKIEVFINGAIVRTVTDTSITATGRVGLRSNAISTTTGHHLDNVRGSAHVAQVKDVETLKGVLQTSIDTKAPTTYVNSEIKLKTPSARVLGSNDVTTSTSASGIGSFDLATPLESMIFSVGAFQEWRIDAYLECSNFASDGSFDGARFGIAIPTGATLIGTVIGWGDATNRWFPFRWASSGLNPVFWMISQSSGRIEIHATVKTGSTTGFCVVQKAVQQAGDQLTILAGSWADAQRIINTD